MNIIRVLASVKFKISFTAVFLLIVTLRERRISSSYDVEEANVNLLKNYSRTAPPTRRQRTSTEYTILGKRLQSIFTMSSYSPGQNSPPLQHAVKTILSMMNKELSDTETEDKNIVDKTNMISQDFHPANARQIKFVRFVPSISWFVSLSQIFPSQYRKYFCRNIKHISLSNI